MNGSTNVRISACTHSFSDEDFSNCCISWRNWIVSLPLSFVVWNSNTLSVNDVLYIEFSSVITNIWRGKNPNLKRNERVLVEKREICSFCCWTKCSAIFEYVQSSWVFSGSGCISICCPISRFFLKFYSNCVLIKSETKGRILRFLNSI